MDCIICHSNVGKLSCLGKTGLRTLVDCAVGKYDIFISSLKVEDNHCIHEKCRKNYLCPAGAVKTESGRQMLMQDEEKVFGWDVDCFLCAKALKLKDKKGKMRKVHQVSIGKTNKERMDQKIVAICRLRTDEAAAIISQRVLSVSSLVAVSARYHEDCLVSFMSKRYTSSVIVNKFDVESEVLVRASFNTPGSVLPSPSSGPTSVIVSLPSLVFDYSFMASSHHHYLQHFAFINSFELKDCIGGGDCFFHAISIGLSHLGISRTVSQLRLAASVELELNSALYSQLYYVEQQAYVQNGQAMTYAEFVRKTRDEHEWAMELTISAMCQAVDVVIRVVSSDTDPSGIPTGFVQNYSIGVHQSQRVIVVGFNKQIAHYVAFVPVAPITVSTLPLPVSSRPVSCVQHNVPMEVDVVTPLVSVIQPLLNTGGLADVVTPPLIPVKQPSFRVPLIEPIGSLHTHPMDESQLTESDDTMMDEARPRSVVSASNDEQCQNCYRIGTASIPLRLHLLVGRRMTRRKLSLLTLSESYVLCSDCKSHLGFDETILKSKMWQSGWPSVIAYLLHHPKHSDIRNDLWNLLPSIHRESWRNLADTSSVPDPHSFHDFTAESLRYRTLITSGVIADFIASNDDFAFPSVKCPAGCHVFTDECGILPFNHFIAWKFGISIFSGDSEMLAGARADWPMRSLQLEQFVVAPGLVVDEEKGLCILLCERHGGGLRKPVVHVPLHPVLGSSGYQEPDVIAAAVLTPNTIRRGRLGKWTNSSHVIDCVGSYSGLSSSCISQHRDNFRLKDIRFGTATFLAVCNREDVYRTIEHRYLDSPECDEFQHALRWYETCLKPSADHTRSCLAGGSVILARDAFAMHDSFFSRDSKQSASASGTTEAKENRTIGLLFVVVHPVTRHGHSPFDTSSAYPLDDDHVLLGVLLRLLVHCPAVHGVLLKRFDATANSFLGRFLGFVKKQVCKSQRSNPSTNFSSVKVAREQLLAETSRLNLVSKSADCEMAADLLCAFSPAQIKSYQVSSSFTAEDFVLSSSHAVVLVYRISRRISRDVVPMQLGQHRLVAGFGDSKNMVDFQFRWSVDHEFWKVRRVPHGQTSQSSGGQFECPLWQLLVYVDSSQVDSMNESLRKSLGGQAKMRCPQHGMFLVKQSIHCKVMCGVHNCVRNARWACLARGQSCENAICFCHGRDLMRGDNVVDIMQGMKGRRLVSRIPVVSSDVDPADIQQEGSFSSDSEFEAPVEIIAPIGQEDAYDAGDDPSLHSRRDIIPIYDVTRRIPGHYLWNKGYGVLRRRLDGHSSVASSSMMQHMVSFSDDPCVSLLYPEGQLFPRTFWSAEKSSIAGAIPSFMLNCLANSANHGVASLSEHHFIRMRDGDLLTSKQNSYWHYVFDLVLNQKLTKYSSQLVFKRGLEFLLDTPDRRSDISESKLPMDEADSTRRIKELASLLKKGKWTYFVTITINETETPGVRVITRAIRQLAGDDQKAERELTDAFLPFVIRAWERFARVLFQELLLRNHTILGKIKHIFVRAEFQDSGAPGNKNHYHVGVTLEEEPERTTLSRICCSSVEFASRLYGTDFEALLGLGLVKDEADYNRWINVFSYVQIHDCVRAGARCMKTDNKAGEKICRFRRQPPMPVEALGRPWFEIIDVPYTEEVFQVLSEIGLASKTEDDIWRLEKPLLAGKWRYRARADEFFMASIPLLSAITRSATNCEATDDHFQISYLVSYICGREERLLTSVTGTANVEEVRVDVGEHSHEKIASCRKIVQQKEESHPHQGREICLAEIVFFVLGFKYSFCTSNFVHVPTMPLANRAAVLKYARSTAPSDTTHKKRKEAGLDEWRQFTESQQAHSEEYGKSSLCLDATSAFNIRPAELQIFDELQVYHECFVAIRIPRPKVSCDLAAAAWLDCAGRTILVNSCSLDKCLQFLNERASRGSVVASQLLLEVFEPLRRGDEILERIFVKHVNAREVVSVISFVKPWDRSKFLTHLCLTLGSYVTEMDVFCSSSVRETFEKAGLLPSSSVVTRADVLSILKRYVVTDLCFHPLSARQFNRYFMAALNTLLDELVNGGLTNYTAYMSEVMLKEHATEQLAAFETLRRGNLIDALFDDPALIDLLPPNLRDASIAAPLDWTPLLRDAVGVSRESILEQTQALDCCVKAIDSFTNPSCRGLKFPCLVGKPGSGKSFILMVAAAYAISKGLQVELLSFTSERARTKGGNHMHLVFPFTVSRSPITVMSSVVCDCIRKLQLDPLKQALIKRTDVILYEEIGLLSSMMFGALDSVLQYIMQNTLPFGGKLLLSSGDSKQLPQISGAPIWSSVIMCTMMQVIVFKCDVRARDPNLRWLNDECRRNLDSAEAEAVADRILSCCSIVQDWSQVPDDAVRIVSTRAAEASVMEQFLATKTTVAYDAVDEVQNNSSWIEAVPHVSRRLDSALYEYAVCRLFVGAVVRMTYNERHASIQFSQGQVAVVTMLPDTTQPLARQKLTLRLAPPGCRQIDPANIPAHWLTTSVARRTTPALVVGKALQMGRRTQFPVRYHLTSTIHRIQGETVSLYATQISEVDRHYRLWQKEQLTVLISRAQQCANIIFVGSASQTREAIISILARSSKWDNIVDSYMSALDVLSHPAVREIRLEVHPFLPLYRELPSACCGYVYLLVSIADSRMCFLGQGDDLKKSLREHNTGYGSERTRPTELHPWGVFAFVCGFECGDRELAKLRREDFFSNLRVDQRSGPEQAYIHLKEAVTETARQFAIPLVIVKCGEVPLRAPNE